MTADRAPRADGVSNADGSSPARKPVIVAPLSRFLAVADAGRSIAFYRDVLGFEVRQLDNSYGVPGVAELVFGRARIQVGTHETARDSTGEERPRGSAVLFLQTDDVAAMRDSMRDRGAMPSEIEKVNGLKMRIFEVRDPDGHTLWFGQSFQEPESAPDPERQLRKLLPSLPLSDVAAGVAYYRDVLGFRVNYTQHDLGVMDRDDVTLLLITRTEKYSGIASCYAYVHDADALHRELVARGANVQGEPVSRPWGLREFQVLDLEGNQISFGQPFE
ncbi:MAG TPA: VOC family protein [Gemmatimonadaceae bacterium]|nr:VOC family protein [Gemmatimonadaceae bacterium]